MTENITVFKQNSILIRTGLGPVYIDPFRLDEQMHDAAFILITHEHYDHFSPEDIMKAACKDTVLVVPEKMEGKAQQVAGFVSRIETVNPGYAGEINGLSIECVPSYNLIKPFHPKKAQWVGYILIVDGERIYIAGDTDATREAAAVQCDIALVPIGGFYTMDAKAAAGLINKIQPRVAIPVHYGELVGSYEDGEVFAAGVKEPIKTEIKIGR